MRNHVFIYNEMLSVFMSCFFNDFLSYPTTSPEHETGWDLGPFAAVLQCLHLDKRLLHLRITKKL